MSTLIDQLNIDNYANANFNGGINLEIGSNSIYVMRPDN